MSEIPVKCQKLFNFLFEMSKNNDILAEFFFCSAGIVLLPHPKLFDNYPSHDNATENRVLGSRISARAKSCLRTFGTVNPSMRIFVQSLAFFGQKSVHGANKVSGCCWLLVLKSLILISLPLPSTNPHCVVHTHTRSVSK